jgi:hypothetical protein
MVADGVGWTPMSFVGKTLGFGFKVLLVVAFGTLFIGGVAMFVH